MLHGEGRKGMRVVNEVSSSKGEEVTEAIRSWASGHVGGGKHANRCQTSLTIVSGLYLTRAIGGHNQSAVVVSHGRIRKGKGWT